MIISFKILNTIFFNLFRSQEAWSKKNVKNLSKIKFTKKGNFGKKKRNYNLKIW